jgi:hypothetical protein
MGLAPKHLRFYLVQADIQDRTTCCLLVMGSLKLTLAVFPQQAQ